MAVSSTWCGDDGHCTHAELVQQVRVAGLHTAEEAAETLANLAIKVRPSLLCRDGGAGGGIEVLSAVVRSWPLTTHRGSDVLLLLLLPPGSVAVVS